MQTGRRTRVRAGSGAPAGDPNNGLFSATLAQNAGLFGRIRLPEAIAAGRVASCLIESVIITSFDQCDWELWYWGNSKGQVPGVDASPEAFRGYTAFTVAGGSGKRIGATGLYYYYVDSLGIYYEDEDAQTTEPVPGLPNLPWQAASNGQIGAFLNVTLINRSAGAKTAGAYFDLTFILEPTQGQ